MRSVVRIHSQSDAAIGNAANEYGIFSLLDHSPFGFSARQVQPFRDLSHVKNRWSRHPVTAYDYGQVTLEGSSLGRIDHRSLRFLNTPPPLEVSDAPTAQPNYLKAFVVGYHASHLGMLVSEACCCSLQSSHGTGLLIEENPIMHPKSLYRRLARLVKVSNTPDMRQHQSLERAGRG